MSPTLGQSIQTAINGGAFPGAVLVAQDKSGHLSYASAFGKASLSSDAPEMTPNTVFQIASQTKLLTTIAALQLLEAGKIALEDDVSSILPEVAKQGILTGFSDDGEPIIKPRTKPLTFKYFLTHQAGLVYDTMDPLMMKYRKWQKKRAGTEAGPTVETRMLHPLIFEPGESWRYSTSIDWTGRIVEILSGQNLDDYFQQHIFAPLGIKDITFWLDKHSEMKARIADMNARDPKSGNAVSYSGPFLNDRSTDAFGGHGCYADLTEYVKVLHSILVDDEKILKKQTTKMMFEPQLTTPGKTAINYTLSRPDLAASFPGEYPTSVTYDWGLGGLLSEGEVTGWRGKNRLTWSGMPNLLWFIDREVGVCGTFGVQLLPPGDRKVAETITAFEKAMFQKIAGPKL